MRRIFQNNMANLSAKTPFSFLTCIIAITLANDLKLSQIVNIANQLPISDCRRIVASLNLDSYDFPESAASAAIKLSNKASCLDLLAQWQSGVGKTQTHTILVRRLKQTGYGDLADWLSKSVFARSPEDEGNAETDTYETETFTFEAETESWTEYEVELTTESVLPNLDTDDADLFAEIVAGMGFIVAALWAISKIVKKCSRQHPEDLPLRSSKY